MIRKIMIYIFGFIFIYFIVGGLIFNHLLSPQTPDYQSYFNQNSVFESNVEGFLQEVKKVENGWLHLKVTMKAQAPGPPEHIHENFDEYFVVEKGTASILVNGQKHLLKAGEHLVIPKGTPHKPFNETDDVVIFNDTSNKHPTMPYTFGYSLSKLYPNMDKYGANSPKILMQLAGLGNQADTWVAQAPIPVQKAIRWLLGPTARLWGYGK